MIDVFSDPLAVLTAAPFFYSLLLYAFGILLPACACCGGKCGDPGFRRCRRDECLSCVPRRGVSTRIGSPYFEPLPEAANVSSVCARRKFSISTRGDNFAFLSSGESLTITATQRLSGSNAVANMKPYAGGQSLPAVFTIQVAGVDWPFGPPQSSPVFESISLRIDRSRTNSWPAGPSGDADLSVDAGVSVRVCGVSLESAPTQYLDGGVFTEAALTSLLSVSLELQQLFSGNYYLFIYSIPASQHLFQYLPRPDDEDKYVVVRYAIEFKRGTALRYRYLTVSFYRNWWDDDPPPVPAGGLPPVTVPKRTFTFSDVGENPPPDPAQPTGTLIQTHSRSAITVTSPDYVFDLSGNELLRIITNVVSPSGYTNAVTRSEVCEESRFVFTPYVFDRLTVVNGNFDEVDEYLAGTRCLTYTQDGTQWETCLDEPNVLCGLGVCDVPELAAPQTATFTKPATSSDCSGVSMAVAGQLFGCQYLARARSCFASITDGVTADLSVVKATSLTQFFDGDLLYSVENGPSRSSITRSDGVVVSLGGDPFPGGAFAVQYECPVASGFTLGEAFAGIGGECPPNSITISLSDVQFGAITKIEGGDGDNFVPRPEGGSQTAKNFCNSCDLANASTKAEGDYVVSLGGFTCGQASYSMTAPDVSVSLVAARDSCGRFSKGHTLSAAIQARMTCPDNLNYEVWRDFAPGERTDIFIAGGTITITPSGNTQSEWSVLRPWMFATGTGSYLCSSNSLEAKLSADFAQQKSGSWVPRFGSLVSISPTSVPFTGQGADSISGSFTSRETLSTIFGGRRNFLPVQIIERFRNNNSVTALAYGAKECAPIGLEVTFPSPGINPLASGESGYVELRFFHDTPCQKVCEVTSESDWISVQPVEAGRFYCITVQQNSGPMRVGYIRLSRVWLVNGVPSGESVVGAQIGSYVHAITQPA